MHNALPNKLKAAVALAAPLILLGFIVFSLLSQGYSLTQIPGTFFDGRLSLVEQLLGISCFSLWIGWYWPSAFNAITEDYVILDRGETLYLSGSGKTVNKNEIININYRSMSPRRQIVFETTNGERLFQSALFIKGDVREIVNTWKLDLGVFS
jgi:hypothetical protein